MLNLGRCLHVKPDILKYLKEQTNKTTEKFKKYDLAKQLTIDSNNSTNYIRSYVWFAVIASFFAGYNFRYLIKS